MKIWESAAGFKEGVRTLPHYAKLAPITQGFIILLLFLSVNVLDYSLMKDLPDGRNVYIAFVTACMIPGIFGIVLSLYWKKPITWAYSIPGIIVFVSGIVNFVYGETLGACIVAGVIVLVIGFSGVVNRVMRWIPLPITMGMVAGVLFRFAVDIVKPLGVIPLTVAIVLGCYAVATLFREKIKIPPIFIAVVVGLIVAVVDGSLNIGAMVFGGLGVARVMSPALPSFGAIISVAIPLAILTIAAENAQAIGVLLTEGYDDIPKGKRVPINAMTILSGVGGIIAPFFGLNNTNIAGPATATAASPDSGPPEGRYTASFFGNIGCIIVAILAPTTFAIFQCFPLTLISMLAGLAMLGVIIGALQRSFSKGAGFLYGASFAFITGIAGITIFKISAPFWALVIGTIISLIVDRKDWRMRTSA